MSEQMKKESTPCNMEAQSAYAAIPPDWVMDG